MEENEMQSDEEIEALLMKANELIASGNLDGAQRKLDEVTRKNARWHFFQSKLYNCRNWKNEARKELETAIELDPENEDYKTALENMKPLEEDKGKKRKRQMGFNSIPDICVEGCCYGVCGCVCEGICEGLGNGC